MPGQIDGMGCKMGNGLQHEEMQGHGRLNQRYQYTMGGQVLETTEEERDIGVQMSCNLKPAGQCSKAAMTANGVLGQVSRAFHYRDRNTFVKVYKLYVQPHLESPSLHGAHGRRRTLRSLRRFREEGWSLA